MANSSQLLLRKPVAGNFASSSCFKASGRTIPEGWLPALKALKEGRPLKFSIASAMIDRAGYPGIAADVDLDKVAWVLPAMKKRALEMWADGERLTGHKGLPLQPTPNLVAD